MEAFSVDLRETVLEEIDKKPCNLCRYADASKSVKKTGALIALIYWMAKLRRLTKGN